MHISCQFCFNQNYPEDMMEKFTELSSQREFHAKYSPAGVISLPSDWQILTGVLQNNISARSE